MSVVYNLVLLAGVADEEDDNSAPAIHELLQWFSHEHPAEVPIRVDELTQGPKYMEAQVWVAAVNFLNVEGFWLMWRGLDWRSPEDVVLIFKDQERSPVVYSANEVPSADGVKGSEL